MKKYILKKVERSHKTPAESFQEKTGCAHSPIHYYFQTGESDVEQVWCEKCGIMIFEQRV